MNEATALALLAAALLGLRHALDPDHLVAVVGLAANGAPEDKRRLVRVGLAWGVGHALSLTAAGLAAIMFGWRLQPSAQHAWEEAVGVVIAAVGLRIVILRAMPALRGEGHHAVRRVRMWPALGIGMLHGLAGTGGVTLALLPLAPPGARVPALLLFSTMTCVSMVTCALLAARTLDLDGIWKAHRRAGVFLVGVVSIVFGVIYAAVN